MRNPIFQDLHPGYKLLFLFVLCGVSMMVFAAFAAELSKVIWGIDPYVEGVDVAREDLQSYGYGRRLLMVCSQVGGFLIPTLMFAQLAQRSGISFTTYQRRPQRQFLMMAFFAGALLAIGGLLVKVLNMELVGLFEGAEKVLSKESEDYNGFMDSILGTRDPALIALNYVVLAVVPGICEEFFFRGGLQQYAMKMAPKPWVGIWFTAVIFAVIHWEFDGFLLRLGMGAVLGYIFYWSMSVWASAATHVAFNAAALTFHYSGAGDASNMELLVYGVFPVCLLLAVIPMRHMSRNAPLKGVGVVEPPAEPEDDDVIDDDTD